MRTGLIFCLMFSLQIQAANLSKADANSLFLKIKKQSTNLVLVNQRSQAITLIDDELKKAEGEYKIKLNDLKYNILNQFLSLPAQEAFEAGAAVLLSDKKKVQNQLQLCLSLEPDNLQCQWLELRYMKRYNPNSFGDKALLYIDKIKDFRQGQLMRYSLLVTLGQFSEVPVNLKLKVSTPEEEVLFNVLNYELAVQTHDFSRAKEATQYFSSRMPDYPDLIFMNYQMAHLWPEHSAIPVADLEKQNEVYKKKCSDLALNTVRKYFYDVSLCMRGLK